MSEVTMVHGEDEFDLPTVVEVFSTDFWKAFAPETILICGLLLIFIIPNLGNSKFRIPLTKVRAVSYTHLTLPTILLV